MNNNINFDKLSKTFDTEPRKKKSREIAESIASYLGDTKGTALEFGCGTGLVGLELLDRFSALTFTDSSAGMIEQVELKIKDLPNTSAICKDLLADNLDQTFDCIFTSLALHHIVDTAAILSKFHSMLNDGGRLIIADMDKGDVDFHDMSSFVGHDGFVRADLIAEIEKAGFKEIEDKTFCEGTVPRDGLLAPFTQFVIKSVK